MALDSSAVFAQRLVELGLEDLGEAFELNGWETLGNFAFAVNYAPGTGADELPFINEVVIPLLGDANSPRKTALRRLYFEAYTAAAADVQRRITKTDDDDGLADTPAESGEPPWAAVAAAPAPPWQPSAK